MPNPDYGVVQFMPTEQALSLRQLMEEIDRPEAQIVGDWPRVRGEPIRRRDGRIGIDPIEYPGFKAMLWFCAERPDAGNYEIHRLPRGGVERGRVIRVMPVAADELFPVRYKVITVANERPHNHRLWDVRLRSVKDVEETDETETTP